MIDFIQNQIKIVDKELDFDYSEEIQKDKKKLMINFNNYLTFLNNKFTKTKTKETGEAYEICLDLYLKFASMVDFDFQELNLLISQIPAKSLDEVNARLPVITSFRLFENLIIKKERLEKLQNSKQHLYKIVNDPIWNEIVQYLMEREGLELSIYDVLILFDKQFKQSSGKIKEPEQPREVKTKTWTFELGNNTYVSKKDHTSTLIRLLNDYNVPHFKNAKIQWNGVTFKVWRPCSTETKVKLINDLLKVPIQASYKYNK